MDEIDHVAEPDLEGGKAVFGCGEIDVVGSRAPDREQTQRGTRGEHAIGEIRDIQKEPT